MGLQYRRILVAAAALVLCAASVATASSRTASVPRAGPEPIELTAEFVVSERAYSGTPHLGPIDLAELFHPGGVGGDSSPGCPPDVLVIDTNRIELSFDPATSEMTGSGTLELRCQFHFGEGCDLEQRSVAVEFVTGLFDAIFVFLVAAFLFGRKWIAKARFARPPRR